MRKPEISEEHLERRRQYRCQRALEELRELTDEMHLENLEFLVGMARRLVAIDRQLGALGRGERFAQAESDEERVAILVEGLQSGSETPPSA